jgi:transposase InsO family protein
MLNLIDEFTRECVALQIDQRLRSTDVIDVLPDHFILRGVPDHIRSDSGPEFVATAVQEWIAVVGGRTAYIEPGSSWENGYSESSNAKIRGELLKGEIFYSLAEAKIANESWRRTTTPSVRTHPSAIGRQLRRLSSGRLRRPEPLRLPRRP